MLKSSKSNNSTKKKVKRTKEKKNNSSKLQNTKNEKVTDVVKNIKQNIKPSQLHGICNSSEQSQSSSITQLNNVSNQKDIERNLIENKNITFQIYANNPPSFNSSYLTTKDLSLKRNPDDLFNLIYSEQVTLTLPNRSWSIYFTEIPIRCIVVSEITLHHDSGLGFIPLYTKQIIFHEKMTYEIFLYNSKASEKNLSPIETITDVMNIITYTNNLKLCSGGPAVSLYNNINIECAYRDNKEKWRHNLCSLEVSEGDTCELCLSLKDILNRHVQRNKSSSRTKNFNGSGKRKRTSLH
uniref:uncharacterized protein LOC127065817 n=1 Tax=Vespula vulgaris TaxID=7454 RepID=UPI0021275D96|nr:uncharacterized protein LOC127065817 [Vespula vulgaris]